MKLRSGLITIALIGFTLFLKQYADATNTIPAVRTHNSVSVWMDSDSLVDETVLYSCDGLEGKARDILLKLGATNVGVSCIGDSDPGEPSYSPTLVLKFDSVRLPKPTRPSIAVQAVWRPIRMADSSNCEAVRQIMEGVKSHFNFTDYQASGCLSSDSAYLYNLTVLSSN